MKKKILSLGLVLVMAMSTSIMAFAADAEIESPDASGIYGGNVDITGETKVPTIKITVPTEGKVLVNPYQMKYTEGEGDAKDKTDSIISTDYYIVNDSDVPVKVNATVTGKIETGSGAIFSAAALKGTEVTKSVFMYLEIGTTSATGTAATYETAFDAKSTKQIVVGAKAVTKAGTVTMDEKGGAAPCASYKFFGSVASAPAKAWTSDDSVSVDVVFTFTPQIAVVAGP